jgi:replicative DNA helicase
LLVESDFYSEANATVFGVMYDLFKQNKPIDLITVKEKLDDK